MQALDLLKDNPTPTEAGDPGRARGQPVPLHRLPEHRQGRRRPQPRQVPEVTVTEERTDDRRASPRSARPARRKEDARLITGRTRWTDNIMLPGHAAPRRWCAARSPTRRSPSIDTSAAKAMRPASSPSLTGEDLADEQGVLRQRLADHRRPEDAGAPRRWPSSTSPAPARSWPSSSPGTPRRRARRRRAGRRRLRRAAAGARPQEAAADDGARPPRPRHQQVGAFWKLRLRRGRAPAATSTRRSPRPATTASSSSASTASSGSSRRSWSPGPSSSTRPASR